MRSASACQPQTAISTCENEPPNAAAILFFMKQLSTERVLSCPLNVALTILRDVQKYGVLPWEKY